MMPIMNVRRRVVLVFVCLALLGMNRHLVYGSASPRSAGTLSEGRYMVHMLDLLAGRYWARVAGRDTNLAPHVNGHDEFAAAWTHEALANLHGLSVRVIHQSFITPGFKGLHASLPGKNVIVVIPGSRIPQESVVVGSHYDGEPFSKGSAFDDTSGSAIILGLSRALGTDWRKHGLPSRTVELVLFDGEEQGLIGSAAYTFATKQGAIMPRPIFMIDEEQNGVGYPARPFGLLSRPPMPAFGVTTGPLSPVAVHIVGPPTIPDAAALALARRNLDSAGDTAFAALHHAYPRIGYRGGSAGAFTKSDRSYLVTGPDIPVCCSDNAPFEALGLPTVTLAGDSHYYDRVHASWAYPFDQPQDTPKALACDTGSSPRPGVALEAALNLQLQISTRLVDDYSPPARGYATAAFSPPLGVGKSLEFQAVGGTTPVWTFGDGGHARGESVRHRYRSAGTYRLTLRSGGVNRTWQIAVPEIAPVFVPRVHDIKPPPIRPWHPPELRGTPGCE